MIKQLPIIKRHIETFLADSNGMDRMSKNGHFDRDMTLVEHELYATFKENPDRSALWDVQNFHADLVRLVDAHTPADGSWENAPQLPRLLETLRFCEEKFEVPMDLKKPVPLIYQCEAAGLILAHEAEVGASLLGKGIDGAIIEKIGHAFRSWQGREPGTMDYGTYRYILLFVPALVDLCRDTQQKDWNLRIFRFFVQYNFNHMGIYNRWERETGDALGNRDPGNDLELIHGLINRLEHIDMKTDLGYDRWRTPLRKQFIDFLERRLALLTDLKALREALAIKPLVIDLAPDEHNVNFNLDFDNKLYSSYASKKEASEVYVAHILAKGGVKMSAHSLRKSDNRKFYSAADRVEESLADKRERLIQQFGLLVTSKKNKRPDGAE